MLDASGSDKNVGWYLQHVLRAAAPSAEEDEKEQESNEDYIFQGVICIKKTQIPNNDMK